MVACPRVVEELIEVLVALHALVHTILPLTAPLTDRWRLVLSHSFPVIPVVVDAVVILAYTDLVAKPTYDLDPFFDR